jgi:hypothetical protein
MTAQRTLLLSTVIALVIICITIGLVSAAPYSPSATADKASCIAKVEQEYAVFREQANSSWFSLAIDTARRILVSFSFAPGDLTQSHYTAILDYSYKADIDFCQQM